MQSVEYHLFSSVECLKLIFSRLITGHIQYHHIGLERGLPIPSHSWHYSARLTSHSIEILESRSELKKTVFKENHLSNIIQSSSNVANKQNVCLFGDLGGTYSSPLILRSRSWNYSAVVRWVRRQEQSQLPQKLRYLFFSQFGRRKAKAIKAFCCVIWELLFYLGIEKRMSGVCPLMKARGFAQGSWKDVSRCLPSSLFALWITTTHPC